MYGDVLLGVVRSLAFHINPVAYSTCYACEGRVPALGGRNGDLTLRAGLHGEFGHLAGIDPPVPFKDDGLSL